MTLLAPDEPAPLAVENEGGRAPVVLVCEHAGRRIPRALGTLGLAEDQLARHFMWDIGARALARALAARLDAALVLQPWSRMVCDCNRPTDAPDFIPETGEGIPVPGNIGLTPAGRAARIAAIWRPFHDGLARALDARPGPAALVTVHSFTPALHGVPRPWLAGVLYDRDRGLAPAILARLRAELGALVGDNAPYRIDRASDWTIPVQAEDRGRPSALIEVRNDLLATPAGVAEWAGRLAGAIGAGLAATGLEAAA